MRDANIVKTIATHDGAFHADDVLAVALLTLLYPEAHVVRTRAPERLTAADLRVDVGGCYDPRVGTFDHHFVGSPARSSGARTPFASAGLIWRNFGEAVVRQTLGAGAPPSLERLQWIDEVLIEPIDAYDTGTTACTEATSLSLMLYRANLTWEDRRALAGDDRRDASDRRFAVVVSVVRQHLRSALFRAMTAATRAQATDAIEALAARVATDLATFLDATDRAQRHGEALVRAAITTSATAVPRTLCLPRGGLPWAELVHAAAQDRDFLFVLAPEDDGNTYVTAIPTEPHGFVPRLAFPSAWAGRRGAELDAVTGFPGGVFCHPAHFMAGWTSHAAEVLGVQAALAAAERVHQGNS